MMIEPKRINNLIFRVATYFLNNSPEIKAYHIDKYIPNCYYGHESDFIKIDDNWYQDPNFTWHKVHKSCFKNPEVCYTIAKFEYDKHEEIYEFMWIDERPLDLTEQEEKDFKELIIYGFNELNHGNDKSESNYGRS
mgnify:CR=1 FL=1